MMEQLEQLHQQMKQRLEQEPPKSMYFQCCPPQHAEYMCGVYDLTEHHSALLETSRPSYAIDTPRFGTLYAYYWGEGPGKPGWWVGPQIGGDVACAFSASTSQLPPSHGWHIVDPDAVESVEARDKPLPNAGFHICYSL